VNKLSDRPGPRYDALLQLLRTSEAIWNSSRLFFARWELSPSQFNILNLLKDADAGMTQSELSRLLIMHRSNVTGLVDRLEARGWVERRDSETDRRSWRVTLTLEGQRLVREILPHYYAAAEAVWGNILPARARELSLELADVADNAARIAAPSEGPHA
jgi:DNA-binding MarR family transcriptional regulator